MQTNDPFMVRAQFAVIFFYALTFATTLILFMWLRPVLDEFGQSVLLIMLGYLGALVQQQSSYIFARQRPNEPGPGETTVTTSPAKTIVTTGAPPTATVTTAATPATVINPEGEVNEEPRKDNP